MLELIVFLAAIILTVVISSKTKINFGLIALGFAFIIGIVFLDSTPGKIFSSYFPTSVITNIVPTLIFFGAVASTGATTVLAHMIGRKMHSNYRAASMVLVFVVMVALTFATAGGEGIRYAISAFAISMCIELQIDPAVGVIVCWAGWQGTTNLPFSSLGSICSGIINDNYADVNAAGVIMMNLVIGLAFFSIMMVALYIWRGRKPFITELEEGETLQISGDEEVHFNRNQKIALTVLFAIVIILLIPSMIQLIAPNPVTKFLSSRVDVKLCVLIGSLILFVGKCADCGNILKNHMNWGMIVMLMGACTLLSEASPLGIVDSLSALLSNMPGVLIVPMVALVCGLLSMFVNGATLTPMFVPLALSFAEMAGVSVEFMIIVIISGFAVTGICPTSGGGAGSLGTVPGAKLQSHVSKIQITMAIVQMIAFAVYCGVLQFFF